MSACSPPDRSDSVERLLARRLGHDFEACLQRVLALDQLQLRGAAAEQLREQVLEVAIDLFERGEQPLARLAVEALDALAQLRDRRHQIVALAGERCVLGLDLAQFFFCAQVDRAQPLALAPQPLELLLDIRQFRQRLAFLDLGQLGDGGRLDFQHVVDFAADVGKPALGALEALLGAGKFLARGARRFERGTRLAVGLG